MNINGEWTTVILDDYFPCKDCILFLIIIKDGPVFSSGKNYELWIMLIEKAYAKVFGSYQAIDGGDPSQALIDLTGGPCYKINNLDNEKWFILK